MAGRVGISVVASGATADGHMVPGLQVQVEYMEWSVRGEGLKRFTYVTIGANAAGTDTWVDTAIVLALQIATTVDVVQALATVAVRQRIAAVAGRAGADRTAAGGFLADGIDATWITAAAECLGGWKRKGGEADVWVGQEV